MADDRTDGFVTYEAAGTIFRQARVRGVSLSTVDALLAALALEYDGTLFSLDQDFQRLRFMGLSQGWFAPQGSPP